MSKFWKLTNEVDSSGSTLYLDGPISNESWYGDEVTPQAFRDEMKKITSNELTVVINSVGGDVFAGMSIYNALRELDQKVTIRVDGLAASIASVIAMAGDDIIMSPGSMMMIHRASAFAAGNADELEKAIAMLEAVEESIMPIYAEKTGISIAKITEMMESETWMSAEKAVELGFATRVATSKTSVAVENIFSTKMAFSMKATKASVDSFVQKVQAEAEQEDTTSTEVEVKPNTEEAVSEATEEATEETTEETTEVETTEVEAEKVETKVVETEEVTETAQEPTNKDNKELKMSTKETAQDQVIAPTNQAQVAPKESTSKYLNTKQSMIDFTEVLYKTAGQNPSDVKDAWAEMLSAKGVTMGITNPDILLPEPLIRSIEDAFSTGGEIYNLVNKTGLSSFAVTRDTVTGENSRAKGYNRTVQEQKAEEVITLASRVLRPQFIFKYLTLPREVIKDNKDTGALLTYVLTELPRRIIREIERAIVIGDGRTANSANKISSFVSIKADAANDIYATEYAPVGMTTYEALVRARGLVKADGAKYLVAKTDFMTELLLEQGVNGGYLFQPGTDLAAVFGFAGVITPDWMDEDVANVAYIMVPSAYVVVGDNSIESFTNFVLKENKNEFLQEIYAGGGLAKLDAAVAIVAGASS